MHFIDYLILSLYLIAIVIVGLILQKRASAGIDSYFLGNRKLPWWVLGASGMASNLDISGTMINTAWIFALGSIGFFIEIRGGVTLIMAFLMIFMGKWNRRAKVMTMAEWMRFRFGKEREGDIARIIAAISIIIVTIAMITYFAVGSGKFIDTFLGIPNIGRVTDHLDDREKSSLKSQLIFLKTIKEKFLTDAKTITKIESERKIVNKAWNELDNAWLNLQQNADNINNLSNFSDEINEFKTCIKSLEIAVDKAVSKIATIHPDNDPPKNIAAYDADKILILKRISDLTNFYARSTSFTIILKSEFLAAILMICLAMIYTIASGLYGVVWTDVFQGILIFGLIIYICAISVMKFPLPDIFSISVPLKDGGFKIIEGVTRQEWTNIVPPWKLDFVPESAYSVYNLFGIAILFYLLKVTIEGAGGTSGYMIQRYFASRSDRESGLLSLFWTFLLAFRWPFIAAIAIMGISYGTAHGTIEDPEKVIPIVINELVPIGIKGLLIAGLMAAAMSTFDSTVNAGASYWVKDIYQAYINPKATSRQLMKHSRWASVIIVILGLLFSLAIKNINEIWGWITMSISAGMIIPTLARWYWWRLNGYGFAIGTIGGMIAAIVQRILFPNVPEYVAFSFAAGISLISMIIGTVVTNPTNESVLYEFYKKTRPFGFWNPVRKKIPSHILKDVNRENRRDLIATFFAVPWQVVLFLTFMMTIMRRWDIFGYLLIALIFLSTGLYFIWFRHLSTEVKIDVDK